MCVSDMKYCRGFNDQSPLFLFLALEKTFIDFRERGREGEREEDAGRRGERERERGTLIGCFPLVSQPGTEPTS